MGVSLSDFGKLDIRAGTITRASQFPEARKSAYKLKIDFGPDVGVLHSSAQITQHYDVDQLIGLQVVAVLNFGIKQIANFMSQCLVLGALEAEGVVLLGPESPVKNGSSLRLI